MEDDGSLIKKNKAFASFIGQGPASNLFQASSWKFLNICTGADPPSNQPWPATASWALIHPLEMFLPDLLIYI